MQDLPSSPLSVGKLEKIFLMKPPSKLLEIFYDLNYCIFLCWAVKILLSQEVSVNIKTGHGHNSFRIEEFLNVIEQPFQEK